MIDKNQILDFNKNRTQSHSDELSLLTYKLQKNGVDADSIVGQLADFQIAIPSWALGTGGTRFGRFPEGGEPRNLEEKIQDIGLLHSLNASSGAISLHIPWDIPEDVASTKALADALNIKFDAVNSNTFQDQKDSQHSYKYGSLSHVDQAVRSQAIAHNKEVIDYGSQLNSKAITVWLSDGSSYPGQNNFRKALTRTIESLQEIYDHLPDDWNMFVEYKPYEPHFYATVIQDWGTSHLITNKLGPKARCLVDLGHHLPNTNIEQIVATLMMEERLGGFHFNDSKYGDDDLTVGSIKPYQLFLIFNELIDGMTNTHNPDLSWMIDASHNLKDPMEDLMQSVEAIKIAYAQALLVDRMALEEAQNANDITRAQEILQTAYRTDVRPLVTEARIRQHGAIDPIGLYRQAETRAALVKLRGAKSISTGL